jgi:predicted ATP-dependent endonuclease of OLD family
MDIRPPEIDASHEKPLLRMFCPEDRIPREIFWAGFGFQVWCQMLTYVVRGKDNSLFIIDEPDIYLHADVQRQLLGILKALGPDILIATHSTEIITEADADDLVVVNKKTISGKRLKNPSQLQQVFHTLGSNLNPTLTQLAKTRRALFVEGRDFSVLSRFARKLNRNAVANRADFAVIPVEGFKPGKIQDFLSGIDTTLGNKVVGGVVFDRDYRSPEECKKELTALKRSCVFAWIHDRKELENFLLVPAALGLAIKRRIDERN